MILLRLSSSLTLWGSAAALSVCAVATATQATALDARRPTGWLWIALAFVVGHVLRLVFGDRRTSFSADRLALTFIVAACGVFGLAHVDGQTSLATLRESVPPLLAFLYPAAVALTPLALSRTAARRDVADHALLIALALTTLDGALCLLPASAGVALGVVALATQLASGRTTLSLKAARPVCWMLAFFVAITIATAHAQHRIDAQPAWSWIVAMTLIGASVAARKRDADDWRRILAAPTLVAALVALCMALLIGKLAQDVSFDAALGTRLRMFRQHPNFLAPFFGLHATLALGLALAASRACRLGWFAVTVLLVAATIHTDSNAGRAAMLLGLVLVPGLAAVRALARRVPRGVMVTLAALVLVSTVALGAMLISGVDSSSAGMGGGLDRVARSLDYRLDAWRNSAAVIASSPWIGIGPNTNVSMFAFEPGSRYFNDPTSPHPHNVLLYVAQAGGLLALVAAVGWIASLLTGLWRRYTRPPSAGADDDIPPVLVASLLAGCAALAVANALDLGLSLMTVVPAPLFAMTGLVAQHRRSPWSPRLGPAMLVTAALLLVAASTAWRPLWARTRSEQAQLHLLETTFAIDREIALPRARRAMAKAISLDPTIPGAHELLARWLESTDQGFHKAHALLHELIDMTPLDSRSHSLLAQLYKRNGMHRQASEAYSKALAAPRRHGDESRDRADRVWCLTQEGERDAALAFLVDALRLDGGVIDHIPWRRDAKGHRSLPIRAGGAPTNHPPLTLVEAAEQLFARHTDDELNGRPVGRRFWMDTYNAFRDAGRDDRALAVLESIERTAPDLLRGEPWTLDNERGKIALDAGDISGARTLFMSAYEKTVAAGSPVEFFKTQAAKAGASGDATEDARPSTTLESLSDVGQILDMHPIYTDHFSASATENIAQGNYAAAAQDTRHLLLFTDDVLERTKLFERTARLALRAADHTAVAQSVAEALDHLAAKPFPIVLLQRDETRSLPGDLAETLARSFAAQGLSLDEMRERAWRLPHYFSSRNGPSLFRLAFLQATGQVDGLRKEAELLLLCDPQNLLAMWAHVTALEALGQWREADVAMRALAEQFGQRYSPERVINQFVASVDHRADDPRVWLRVAVLKLLQGYYADSAGLFARGREHAQDDPLLEAELAQWQSRAALYAGRLDSARKALTEAVALDPARPMLARRLEVMP